MSWDGTRLYCVDLGFIFHVKGVEEDTLSGLFIQIRLHCFKTIPVRKSYNMS